MRACTGIGQSADLTDKFLWRPLGNPADHSSNTTHSVGLVRYAVGNPSYDLKHIYTPECSLIYRRVT